MTPQEQLHKAESVAKKAHANQFRRDNITPYILHVEEVVRRVNTSEEKTVAWLHDVAEDCGITKEDLLKYGFSQEVINAVMLLTKTRGYDHSEYMNKIRMNPLATAVKIADMRANLADTPTKRQIERYSNDLLYLTT